MRLPVARLRVQELGELPLRQHHAGGEVLERQPEQLLDRLRDPRVGGEDLGRRRPSERRRGRRAAPAGRS